MNGETRDERLRRMLREADPAAGETGLTTEEIREIRRTVLTSVPEPRRRLGLSPALAGAAMAVLAAIVALAMWPRSEPVAPPAPQTVRVAKPTPRSPRPGVNSRATNGVPSGTRAILVPRGTTASRPAASAPGGKRPRPVRKTRTQEPERLAAVGAVAQDDQEEPERRQVQFDTPGGTRVIWILTSGNAL